MKYCKKCNREFPAGKFCKYCGIELIEKKKNRSSFLNKLLASEDGIESEKEAKIDFKIDYNRKIKETFLFDTPKMIADEINVLFSTLVKKNDNEEILLSFFLLNYFFSVEDYVKVWSLLSKLEKYEIPEVTFLISLCYKKGLGCKSNHKLYKEYMAKYKEMVFSLRI